jgi:hydrogenase maturation protease
MAAQTLILGVGNVLFGDDAIGIEIVKRLREIFPNDVASEVEIIDGGTSGLYLLPYLENRERVLIVDAVDFKGTPGQILEISGDHIPRFIGTKLSEHQVNLHEVLSLLDLLDGPSAGGRNGRGRRDKGPGKSLARPAWVTGRELVTQRRRVRHL